MIISYLWIQKTSSKIERLQLYDFSVKDASRAQASSSASSQTHYKHSKDSMIYDTEWVTLNHSFIHL